jgi:chromosomal replication initiator protein
LNTFSALWEETLKRLEVFYRENNNLLAYTTYIVELTPEHIINGVYYLKAQNPMHKTAVIERFKRKIKELMEEVYYERTGETCSLELEIVTADDMKLMEESNSFSSGNNIAIRPEYTFDNFIVGTSNKIANAASMTVAASPGIAYNPLFIYGGPGLGKTHLMHAIGNKILENNPSANIIYITSESFINEFVESITQKKRPEQFRNKFRNADALLIDDIQFISRAKETQTELFHTYNTLHDANKQLVFTSDKPPSEIPSIEERLLGRFQWGLTVDISQPDYETRIAILKSKLPRLLEQTCSEFLVDDDVIAYIASKDDTNIRDLEGALKRVIAHANVCNMETPVNEITMDMAKDALVTFFKRPEQKDINGKTITDAVCKYYNITFEELQSPRKDREVSVPRQIAMYLMIELTNYSNKKVASMLNRKDHTTVLHAAKKIRTDIENKTDVGLITLDIKKRIMEG